MISSFNYSYDTKQVTGDDFLIKRTVDANNVYGVERNTKELDPHQQEAIRAELRRALAKFDNNQTRLANRLGFQPASISKILAGKQGVGMNFLEALSRLTGKTIDQLRGTSSSAQAFGDAPGWLEAETIARQRMPGIHPGAFERARMLAGIIPPSPITPEFVIDSTLFLLRHMPPEERLVMHKEPIASTKNNKPTQK